MIASKFFSVSNQPLISHSSGVEVCVSNYNNAGKTAVGLDITTQPTVRHCQCLHFYRAAAMHPRSCDEHLSVCLSNA